MRNQFSDEQWKQTMMRVNKADKKFKPNIERLPPSIKEALKKLIKRAK